MTEFPFLVIAQHVFELGATKHVVRDQPGHMLASDFFDGPQNGPEAYGVIRLKALNGYQIPHFTPIYTVGLTVPVWYPDAAVPFGEVKITAIERFRLHAMPDGVIKATGLSFDEWRAEWDRDNPDHDWRKNPAVIVYTVEKVGVYTEIVPKSDEFGLTDYGVDHAKLSK